MSARSKKRKLCPRLGSACIEDKCTDWVAFPVDRLNALTGSVVTESHYMCNEHWKTKIAFDAAKLADHTGAAIESFRNEMMEDNQEMLRIQQSKNARLPNQ